MALALGKTVKELQQEMSFGEVRVWVAYMKKYGPFNDVRRYDRPAAILGSILSRAHGGKATQADFMPWGKDVKVDPSLEDMIGALGRVKIGR